MKKIYIPLSLLVCNIYAIELSDFVNLNKCDRVVDKQIYKICYSYKHKGPLAGWAVLDGNKVNSVNIKKRERFYSEKNIPMKYRTKYSDYTGTGVNWNRGHYAASDASFDYSIKSLRKTYSMVNIVPQSAKVNQKTWIKVEKYGRSVAKKLGYVNSITLSNYSENPEKIKNNISIPSVMYRIYYNNEKNFIKCFKYENKLNIDYKNDKLKNHIIDCSKLKV